MAKRSALYSENFNIEASNLLDADSANKRVVLAMSGGVDSCAAGILLHDAGYEVIGISMQVWDYRTHGGNSKRATCCSPSDFDDARKIAERRGFPFYVFDFEDSFKENVIDKFVNTYLAGKTPNPCLDCNRKVKFHELRQRARSFSAHKIATGHYARIRNKSDGKKGLFTARDLNKDQSYFLYALREQELLETIFPVGDMLKSEVREILSNDGYSLSSKPESQDICFVSGTVSDFIEKKGVKSRPGLIINKNGEFLGNHEGIFNYTVGQRKGLGISSHNPLYVISIEPENNRVVVGNREDLERDSFSASEVNWIQGSWPIDHNGGFIKPLRVIAKLRYRHEGVICEVMPAENDPDQSVTVRFVDDWTAVSPGQAVVFYSENQEPDGAREVLGGGIIS
ncbi:MAG TPA: tRNA 2-thiouridine(34) synthase MnmA [Oligoflexia bacterium]|nr:tRNA 2-thiouridine(34) synthase MnmA [Oligoflexia bacterium]HMP49170.1 tRNA 2-thiouridine(34) synthase MnmA [Oligoflexia bacterium]